MLTARSPRAARLAAPSGPEALLSGGARDPCAVAPGARRTVCPDSPAAAPAGGERDRARVHLRAGPSWFCPSVTTRSPACDALGDDASAPCTVSTDVARRATCCPGRPRRRTSLGSALHRRRRDDQRALARLEMQARLDELARPERAVGVGKVGLEPDASRCRGLIWLSMTVSLPVPRFVSPSRSQASTVSGPLANAAATRAGRPAGRVKSTAMGSIWVRTTMPLASVGVHHVAHVHLADAGDAVDGRGDARELEVQPGVVHLRLVQGHGGPGRLHRGHLRVVLLLGDELLGCQILVADQVALVVVQGRESRW